MARSSLRSRIAVVVFIFFLLSTSPWFSSTISNAYGATSNACGASQVESTSSAVPLLSGGVTDSAVDVSAKGDVMSLEVTLNIDYPFDSDLQIYLKSPTGTLVTLADTDGSWGHDFLNTVFSDAAATSVASGIAPFTGQFRPVERLAEFRGSVARGKWTLEVNDRLTGYGGQLSSWSLNVMTCASLMVAGATVGAPAVPPLPTGAQTGPSPVVGTLITVASTSDLVNGNVSSVNALESDPGSDGVSLREAITATNNDPGIYTIDFASSLAGATIDVGASTGSPLPPLQSGGVFIDGDITGDGEPGVTLDGHDVLTASGLTISSSANRLFALAIQNFSTGVSFSPSGTSIKTTPTTNQTYTGNVVSDLTITGASQSGISMSSTDGYIQCQTTACSTDNQWIDTRLVGNSITSTRGGIQIDFGGSVSDQLNATTVADNDIVIDNTNGAAFPIDLTAGDGNGANDNVVSDAVIANNSIEASTSDGLLTNGINLTSGSRGGSKNTVEAVEIIGNHVQFSTNPIEAKGVTITMSDGCSSSSSGVGTCSENNVAKNLEIVGNSLSGQDAAGIEATEPCCGTATQSTLSDVHIDDNVISGVVPAANLNPWGIVIGPGGAAVSNVTIANNTITQRTTDPGTTHTATLASGGVAVLGGLGSDHGSIRGVDVIDNRIDTGLVGITIVGGGPGDEQAAYNSTDNTVSAVKLVNNIIASPPSLVRHWDKSIEGIAVIGGLGGASPTTGNWKMSTGNTVSAVTLQHNVVAGVVNSVTLASNIGLNASGNTVTKVTKVR
jgi:subtilisin-like proprotein convertase family protein